MNQPNAEQVAALKAFATKHGAGWKHILLSFWIDGRDANEPDGHLLRQVRNQLGPKWLSAVNLEAL